MNRYDLGCEEEPLIGPVLPPGYDLARILGPLTARELAAIPHGSLYYRPLGTAEPPHRIHHRAGDGGDT